MVLQRLTGKTEGAAPVLTLITQFGGGKTHTLTLLYHLAKSGKKASAYPGVSDLIKEAGVAVVPEAKVVVLSETHGTRKTVKKRRGSTCLLSERDVEPDGAPPLAAANFAQIARYRQARRETSGGFLRL
jgi:hypothetical protein